MQLGFTYLPPNEALQARGSRLRNVVLTEVLRAWLTANNGITFKGQRHAFSAANLNLAIQQLLDEPYDGLIRTNEKLYERLTLRVSLKQTIDGDSKSFSLRYIDWQTMVMLAKALSLHPAITATPELRIRTMQKRWGSCTETGVITLNLKLIQVPKALIDYVIIHELCHLKEHNHSHAYYHLLDRVLPDWRARRDELNKVKVA